MVTDEEAVTLLVLTVNVALLAPAATVTFAGTVACCGVAARKGDGGAAAGSWPAESHRAG